MVIYSLCSGDSLEEIAARYANKGYGTFKADLADIVVETIQPIQQRYQELTEPGVIEGILEKGREKAEPIANKTLAKFQKKLGVVPRFNTKV